ncbi:hypothetical protein CJO78_21780 (plasmid) [Ralstonia solanacearum]|nr:hypothetical protein CJO78_21780 [Ralstonia solanacearum]AXW08390.1 hypothetical protein CJO82_21450 [Ralstonia solanacearum]AXW26178.1 hypothetical protein CJO86_21715 [Ralstonia solanacearum]AXW64289.1 hypothetical protein CJO94_21635 [Ralstonia solanacearum]AXW83089.1 hypothetical protein CJO98_21810 [Ralstonia solanacearum]
MFFMIFSRCRKSAVASRKMVPMSFWVTAYLQTLCHVRIFTPCVIYFLIYPFLAVLVILFREINVF